MTSPTSVGEVSVEVEADARRLAKSLKAEVEKAFKGLDFSKQIQDAVGRKPITVDVKAVVDVSGLRGNLQGLNVPTLRVTVEPDFTGFSAKLRAGLAAISARSSVNVPVNVGGGSRGGGLGGLSLSLGSLVSGPLKLLQSGFQSVASTMAQSGNQAVAFGGQLLGALTSVAGPVGMITVGLVALGAGLGAVAVAAALVAPALSAVAGAVAALPGILAGAGAGLGTLALGFKGISDAFKPKAGGGGGGGGGGEDPASRARRIAGAERGVEAARRGIAAATRGLQSANRGLEQAERGVADAQARVGEAQRRALQAQQAVNRARKEAKEDIEDLNRSLSGAKLSEEDATLRVTEALRELNKAKESGVLPDIQRADLEYRQAQQALEEAKDATEDLGEAAADANKKGVEGSDKVQDALQDQVEANDAVRDAIRGVADAQIAVIEAQNGVLSANDALKSSYDGLKSAQDSLAEAQKKAASSGGGGGLAEVVKLAPAAQKFVDAIKALKPAFESLRLDVQQRLFQGLDQTVTRIGETWIPALRTTLGSYADTFNGFFKNLGAGITTPKFITDLQIGAEAGRKALSAIGTAVTSKLVPAFGALSAAAAPFIEKLGDEIAGIVTEFSEWVLQGEKTGGLKSFFATATESLHDIFTTGKLAAQIVGKLFTIITGGDLKTGKSGIDSFNDGLERLNTYLGDPQNQQDIRDFFKSIADGVADIKKFIAAADEFIDKFRKIKESLFGTDDNNDASSAGETIGQALIAGILTGIGKGFETTWGIIAGVFWSGPNSLLGRIKRGLGIASPSTLTTEMGTELINGLIKGIGDKVEELKNKARELPGKIREGIGNAAGTLVQKGKDFATGLRNGLQTAAGSVQAKATEVKNRVSNAFSNAATLLTGRGQSIGNSLRNGLNSIAGNISVTASNLKTRISNAFSNAGTFLYNHGYNTVVGLWNGIASLGGWLYNKVADFIRNNITTPVKNFLGINSPSKLMFEMGGYVTEGLALGIESEESRVAKAAAAIAAAALPQVGTAGLDLFGNADAAITRSLQVAGANSLQASWAPGMTGDKILDALRGSIKFSHRGDVQAALGSA